MQYTIKANLNTIYRTQLFVVRVISSQQYQAVKMRGVSGGDLNARARRGRRWFVPCSGRLPTRRRGACIRSGPISGRDGHSSSGIIAISRGWFSTAKVGDTGLLPRALIYACVSWTVL